MKLIAFSLLLFCAVGTFAEKARFDFYKVYEIFIENEQQLELMTQIENYPDGVSIFSKVKTNQISLTFILPMAVSFLGISGTNWQKC